MQLFPQALPVVQILQHPCPDAYEFGQVQLLVSPVAAPAKKTASPAIINWRIIRFIAHSFFPEKFRFDLIPQRPSGLEKVWH